MAKNYKLFFILFILIIPHFCLGQEQNSAKPLTEIITSIESRFEVKFSYASEDVSTVSIIPPKANLNLKETLNYLNANTLLNFKTLDNRYITVSVIEKTIAICGYIISEEDNEALMNASIRINNTKKGTTTNDQGQFELNNVPLNSTLSISYLGFETQQIPAKTLVKKNNYCETIALSTNNETLNQVIITKFLTTGLQQRADGSTVLNTKRFGILPGLIEPDILQSIQALPGIESTDESIANINVRGGTNSENLMLWDDIKMYHSGHFFGLISAYNPNLTNKVVVTKNGTSSAYSDGVSSTINMQTENNLTHTFSGGLNLNLISGDAFLQIPISKSLELHVSGRRSFTDVLDTPTYSNYFERSFQDSAINTSNNTIESKTDSNFIFYDYTAKLLFNLNKNHKFRANVIGINNNLDYEEQQINVSNSTESRSSNLSQENLGFGAQWSADWSKKFSTTINSYYSKYNVDAIDYRIETDQKLTQANEVLETGAKLNSIYKWSNSLNLLIGYQFNETGILNETTVTAPSYNKTKKDVLLNHAAFSEVEYNNGSTYLRAGLRANYFQKFKKTIIEPRFNFRQKLSRQFAIKLEGEFKNQSATQIVDFQNDFLGVENRRWILANEDNIPISTSKQGSFGINFKHNNLSIDATSYYKIVDGITASNQGFYNRFQFLNATGEYTSKGAEFLINKTSNSYSIWASYSYAINTYHFSDFTPSIFPNNVDIRHSISAACNINLFKALKLSVGGVWRTGRPYTKPVEGQETVQVGNDFIVNYDTPNSSNLDPFKRLDASLSYHYNFSKNSKLIFRAGVINITNEKNSINRYYQVDANDTSKAKQIDNKSLNLTPNMSLKLMF